jgi:drug/metabolite transporter (DMT)-like permease
MISGLSGELLALLSGLLWAVAVMFFKKTGDELAPLPLNLFKSAVSLLLLVPAMLASGSPLLPEVSGREWLLVAISGVLGIAVADTLFFAALNRLGAGLTAVVDCLYSPAMIGLAIVFLGDRLTLRASIGAVLVVSAVFLGTATRPIEGRTRRDLVVGALLGTVGMVTLAVSIVVIKPILVGEKVLWFSTARLAIGTLPLLPLIFLRGEGAELAAIFRPSRLWATAVPACVLGGGLAMVAWIGGMTLLFVSSSAILNQLSTIFIFVLAAVVLKEPLTRRRMAAVALAFAGAILVITGKGDSAESPAGRKDAVRSGSAQTASTAVTSGTCSLTRSSMPALRVIWDMGQPPQAPVRRT